MRRVAVTGIGSISPIGFNSEDNWKSLMAGKSGIRPMTLFDASDYACKIAGEITDYDPKKYFNGKDLKKIDRFIQFAMVASDEALVNCGIDLSKENLERFGCIIGVGLGGLSEIQSQYKELLEKGPRRVSPFFIPMVIGNLAAGQVSIKHGLKGPNTCITTACSSSSHAIGESFRLIQYGGADVMVAGGAESTVSPLGVGGFCAARALSARNDDPATASRPWDRDRDGFVLGEGAGVMVLEEYEHAKARGARIYAEVAGYGMSADAFHMTQPAEDGDGARRCMLAALKNAGLAPGDIQYINAHGTSTPLGDVAETQAVKRALGDATKHLVMNSTKSMTGHLLGAAGGIEAVFTALALYHQISPPTINIFNQDERCDLDYCANHARPMKIDAALSNSFGFGGTNGTVAFKRI
jgi:3-oxoacyl-[acyl-carrier-protein] synthase II